MAYSVNTMFYVYLKAQGERRPFYAVGAHVWDTCARAITLPVPDTRDRSPRVPLFARLSVRSRLFISACARA
jgi:hypothetical protein